MLADDGLLHLEVSNFSRPAGPYSAFLQFPQLYSFTYLTLVNYLQAAGFTPIFADDAVGRSLVIISRRSAVPARREFVSIDVPKYAAALARKSRVYRYAARLPQFSVFGKLKGALYSGF